MRNVLERYKGKLYKLAPNNTRAKIKKLDSFAERLSVDNIDEFSYSKLLNHENVWNELHNELSSIAKLNTNISYENLKMLHTKYNLRLVEDFS